MSSATRTVLTVEDLKELVGAYRHFDEFTFDVETVANRKVRMTPGERLLAEEERSRRRAAAKSNGKATVICPCCGNDFFREHNRQFCTEACRKAANKDRPALDPATNKVWSVSLAGPGRSDVIPCGHPKGPKQLWKSDVFEALEPLFFSDRRKVNQNVAFDLLSIAKYYDNEIPPPPYGDTLILTFLLNENLVSYKLGALTEKFLGYQYAEKLGEKAYLVPFSEAMRYSVVDAKMAWLLWWRAQEKGLSLYFWERFEREMEVMRVLLDMRATGAYVDLPQFQILLQDLDKQKRATHRQIEAMAGHELNLNSTDQLSRFLYDELKLPCRNVTPKGQRATDAQTLKGLTRATRNPKAKEAIEAISRYKDLTKMLGTYVAGYFPHIEPDDRIRASFNQAVAKTGRLSCSQPNLQNIPARYKETFEATMVRRLFKAPPGRKLIVADYSQIELRILAHLTRDPLLLRAYRKNIDLHALTASRVFKVPIDTVTKEQRFVGKTSNFNFAFEGGPRRVVEIADISLDEAEKVYDAWHETYPAVKRWGYRTKERCRERKYVRTLFGRKRRLPQIAYRDPEQRSYAERQAVNHPVQGTAADIAKIALIRVSEAISGYDAKLVLQVHDEFVIEVAEPDATAVVPLVRKAMEDIQLNGKPVLDVPLVVDISIGDNWADCK